MKIRMMMMAMALGVVLAAAQLAAQPAAAKAYAVSEFPQWQAGIQQLCPNAATLVQIRKGEFQIRAANGQEIGQLFLELVPAKEKKSGYRGPINLAMIFRNQKALGVIIGQNRETPRFLLRARQGVASQWNGCTLEQIPQKKVTPVTHATFSSNAIIDGVRKLAEGHLMLQKQQRSAGK